MEHFNKIVKSCAGTDWTEVIFNLKIRKIEQQLIENIEGIEWEGRFKGFSDVDSAVAVVWEIINDVDSKSVTRQIESLLGEIENEITQRKEMYSYLKPGDEINQGYPRFRNCQHIDNSIERLRYLQEWLMSESGNHSTFVQEIIIERFRDDLKEHLQAQVPDWAEEIMNVTNVY
jgi:hypothetical protein